MMWAGMAKQARLQWTAEELHYLQQIVNSEAMGEDLKGQILVANAVLNRINDANFPDTIIAVIKQSRLNADGSTAWQFTPASRPDFSTATVSETTIEAVRLALSGVDYSQWALFFNGIHLRTTSWGGGKTVLTYSIIAATVSITKHDPPPLCGIQKG